MGIHLFHVVAAVMTIRTRVRDPVVLKEIPEVVHGEGSALVDHRINNQTWKFITSEPHILN